MDSAGLGCGEREGAHCHSTATKHNVPGQEISVRAHLGLAPPALGASRASKYREKWEVQGRGGYSLLLKCPTASQKLNRMLYNTVQSWQLDFDLCVRRHHDDYAGHLQGGGFKLHSKS